jgi:hypothetical protein
VIHPIPDVDRADLAMRATVRTRDRLRRLATVTEPSSTLCDGHRFAMFGSPPVSKSRFSSPRLAAAIAILGAVAAQGTVAVLGACSAPPSGVHVVVTMSAAGYDDQHAFDHLTMKARIGARRAVACLYPADAVERAVALDGEPRPKACADRRTQRWTGPPTAEGWALDTQPLSINVEAAEGEDVDIEVIGGLGGLVGTVQGSGAMRASSAFPELRVELAGELVLPECDAHLESLFLGGVNTLDPMYDAEECGDKSWFRSPAVVPVDAGGSRVSRVLNDPGLTCPDGGASDGDGLVWSFEKNSKATGDKATWVRVHTRGRFVRCVEGDPGDPGGCTVTADCTTLPVGVGVRALDAGPEGWDLKNVTCLPPTSVPITWSVEIWRPAGKVLYGLAQDVKAAGAGSCFLDVYEIATEAFEGGAP